MLLLASVVNLLFCSALMASARPAFSAFVAFACVAALVIVNNAKYETLREPFVFTDLSLFSQLFRHPRLYLPFLSLGKLVAIVLGIGVFVIAFVLDAPLGHPHYALLACIVALSLGACAMLPSRLPLTLDPPLDHVMHGFVAVFAAYLVNGMRVRTFRAMQTALDTNSFALANAAPHRPDVLVIQSESFFDARRLHSKIRASVLEKFDIARAEACLSGELDVPAWGANTMRSEFALLTGLDQSKLGYARFYPYAFVRRAGASLASWLKGAGYRTSAIHPYHSDFFGRDRAYRHLGFECFIDIKAFETARRAGAYVADAAVADKIIESLEASAEPAFIFAVTMENHGPLHLETVGPGEGAAWHALGDAPELHELTAYLRHLENADAMIGRLLEYLRTRERDTIVCFYGDHVPAMSRAYRHIGQFPHKSDFFIWTNYGATSQGSRDLRIDELGRALVGVMEGERATRPAPQTQFAPAEMN
ncbi:LTA synthase family protein [Caballeronia sp. LZ035]|uniref:LTA synthase family protein n=1 Tax=Caballeronia sp. LZ035 TaxID=3038568 RepID=UPI00285E211E|nr:LTA synthase family protein [Caballeronia sp. LZ035]MDR5757600.1 LTA synthase family protein [Caballeronia sp. LZ035]